MYANLNFEPASSADTFWVTQTENVEPPCGELIFGDLNP